MLDYEQSFGRGFRDSTLGGLNWLKGDRGRATGYFVAHFSRVTDALTESIDTVLQRGNK